MFGRLKIRTTFFESLPIFLLLALLSAWAMFPVLSASTQKVIGWTGDNLQYLYMIGWIGKALQTGMSPWIDSHLNYPDGLHLATTDTPFLSIFILTPLTWLVNEIFTYNLLIFLGYFLSGLFTYLWIKRLTGSKFAGAVAGLIFLLAPYRVAHSYGHLNLISTQFIPVFFWALDRVLLTERPSLRNLAYLLISTFLVGAMSQYYLVICLSCGILYVLASRPNFRYLLLQGWKIVLSVISGGVLSALPYLAIWDESSFRKIKIFSTRPGSANLSDFLIPSRLHPIWGSWIEQINPMLNWIEYTAYIGFVAGILAILALLWRESPFRLHRRVWLISLLFSFVMALGTDLHVFGNRPAMPENPIWLPAYYFGQLPLISTMRVWSRYSVLVIFFIALLAGLGAKWLESVKTVRPVWKFLLLGLIVIDFLPGHLASSSVTHRPIDSWIGSQPGDFAVGFIPNPPGNNYPAIYATLSHGKSMPAYIHPVHLPKAYQHYIRSTEDFPEKSSIKALRRMNLRYLILLPDYFDGQERPAWQVVEARLADWPDFSKVAEVDGYMIYEFER